MGGFIVLEKKSFNILFGTNLPERNLLLSVLNDSQGIVKWNEGIVSKCKSCMESNINRQKMIDGLEIAKIYLEKNKNWSCGIGNWRGYLTDFQVARDIIDAFIPALKNVSDEELYIKDVYVQCEHEEVI
ncbi:MAG: hypothetical protein OIN86_13135 [Candidatus Methanoperedens sp.]|nr:hypothetical protein [Candidatus Methanoperedens sp.]CAG0949118.1 hypothetical protein METP1_00082 [Methanosarcinales archaeon]